MNAVESFGKYIYQNPIRSKQRGTAIYQEGWIAVFAVYGQICGQEDFQGFSGIPI